MKKNFKVIAGFIFLLLTILTPVKIAALTDETLNEYTINKYDVNIVVNENNTFDITERITAYFNIPKHGIYRMIPLRNTLTRADGTTSNNRAQVTNLSVDNEYSVARENNNYKIKIGSANRSLTGEQTYTIKYTYNIGKDPMTTYDELYYNIIGPEWDTTISNVTFSITMPKEFEQTKVGFSSGPVGLANSDNIEYTINDKTISGSLNGVINTGEALTVRCELPEGYFVGAGFKANPLICFLLLLPILFLVISIILWSKFGRDEQVVETVEFYPPEGYNSLEVGFLYKGKAENQDVTSLLIYLANKGYIKIEETEEKTLFKKAKGFKIIKVKEYDGNNINEQKFLAGLFKTNKKGNVVTASDLYDNFYITMNDILDNVNDKENKNKIFEKKATSKRIFVILMIVLAFCFITSPVVPYYGEVMMLLFGTLFPGIGLTIMIVMLFSKAQTIYVNGIPTKSALLTKVFGLIFGVFFGVFPWLFIVLPALLEHPYYLIGYVIGIGCIIGMIICLIYLPKRTAFGNEILGKLRGFKNFLESAEKEKLEAMVMEDPTYFYNILPFTYVLGVSDKWIKKFESISMQAPYWYVSSTPFSVNTFGTFMDSTMVSAQRSMTSSPQSTSTSGGFSGGGFSGGGSGGGGGGSW